MSVLSQRDRRVMAKLLRMLARSPQPFRDPSDMREMADALELDADGDLVKFCEAAVYWHEEPTP